MKFVFGPNARLLVVLTALLGGTISAQMGPGDFTVIALPDTQNYSQYYPHVFNSQTAWIVRNKSALNIKFVVGLGDIVNNGSSDAQQQNADAAVRDLDQANIPYLLALGNHDYKSASPKTRDTTNFNRYFGPWRYSGESWYRGNYPSGSNANFYGVFDISGRKYLVMALEFYPRNSVLSWASSVISANSDKHVILIMHSYLLGNRRVGRCDGGNAEAYGLGSDNDGQEMWTKLMSKHRNIFMVLNGHFHGWGRRADLGNNGNLVNQILADFQKWPDGGGGYLRIMTFRPWQNRVDVKTYSPYYKKYLTDSGNQFSIPMHNAVGTTGTGKIEGRVRSSSTCKPISGVRVTTSSGSATTDSQGKFTISSSSGWKSLTASRSGYKSTSLTTKVDPTLSGQVDFFLTSTASAGSVSVSLPANGATVGTPTRFVASAGAPSGSSITMLRIYVDYKSRYSVRSSRLDTSLSLARGTRRVTVQAWDSAGRVYKKSFSVNVR